MRGGGDFFGSRQSGLPPLKIADLYSDRQLLGDSSQAAKQLLQGSPDLSEYPGLKEKSLALINENGSEGMN